MRQPNDKKSPSPLKIGWRKVFLFYHIYLEIEERYQGSLDLNRIVKKHASVPIWWKFVLTVVSPVIFEALYFDCCLASDIWGTLYELSN